MKPICIYFLKPCWKFSWEGTWEEKILIYESKLNDDNLPLFELLNNL